MRTLSALFLALCFTLTSLAQTSSPSKPIPLGQAITSELDDRTLQMASQRTTAALGFESRRDWTSAQNQYQAIISEITSELRSPLSQQNQMLYYFLGLANADYARVLLNQGAEQVTVDNYLQHLSQAENALQRALELTANGPIPASQLYAALTVVKTYQGNYSGARTDVASLQKLQPADRAATQTAETLSTVPPATQKAANDLRIYRMKDKPLVIAPASGQPSVAQAAHPSPMFTDQQQAALEQFGEAVGKVLFPNATALIEAGIKLVRAFGPQQTGTNQAH